MHTLSNACSGFIKGNLYYINKLLQCFDPFIVLSQLFSRTRLYIKNPLEIALPLNPLKFSEEELL